MRFTLTPGVASGVVGAYVAYFHGDTVVCHGKNP
jgi:hypothetical protein